MDTVSASDFNLKTIGKYQLVGEIGRSAAGVTYRARDPFRKRDLALKVIAGLDQLDAAQKDQLYDELGRSADLAHRHIGKVLDIGEVDGRIYIARDLLGGSDLKQHLASHDVPVSEKLSLIAQVCEALAFAHGKDVAHGDLKPGNIFIADGRDAAVLDFGIGPWQALMLASNARPEGLLPNYLAPEQVLGQRFDGRSDLFAIALVLYEILAGKYPFQAPPGLIPREIVHTEVAPLRQAAPQFSEDLEQLLVRALCKNPDQRIQTAEEFAAGLYTIARRTRREEAQNVAPEIVEASLPKFVMPSPEPFVAPVTMDTALQPWAAGPTAKAEPQKAETPKVEAPKIVLPAAAALAPASVPAPVEATSAPSDPVVITARPGAAQPAPAVAARPGTAVTPMPRRFQHAPEPPKIGTKRMRLLAVAAGAFLAAWIISSFLTRDSLHASQKPRVETTAPPVAAPDTRTAGDLLTLTPAEAAKLLTPAPAEPAKKDASVPQLLRSEVRPLWEAGKYADALAAVDRLLVQEPANADARTWKKKILAAQEAEAAVK